MEVFKRQLMRSRGVWRLLVGLATAVVLLAVYYIYDPSRCALFPPCPWYSLTGYQCPGCGSQRALHALLHLRIVEAFYYNPLLVVALPYLATGLIAEYVPGGARWRRALFGRRASWVALVVIVGYWVVRNLW